MPQNQVWNVAKKGGTLLTITSNPAGSMMGGGFNTNLSKSDFVQIAGANELVKPDQFMRWEEQRAGARQQMEQQQFFSQQSMPQMMSTPLNAPPQINIKMVGGNDFSKGGEDQEGNSKGGDKSVTISGGGQDGAFNNLVIPSIKGGQPKSLCREVQKNLRLLWVD